jgi:hypothetical protein
VGEDRVDPAPVLAPSAAGGPGDELWTPRRARRLAERLLGDLPCRLAHSLQAGARARSVVQAVPETDADLLIMAAVLHDVGYAPALHRTNFHPLDGAVFLLRLGAPERLAALVAHHSEAWLLASARGLLPALGRFPHEQSPVSDAVTYADMTSGPCGEPLTVADRLADIARRHASEPAALRTARSAREPLLRAAAERVIQRAPRRQ